MDTIRHSLFLFPKVTGGLAASIPSSPDPSFGSVYVIMSSRVHSGFCSPHSILRISSGVNAASLLSENTSQKPRWKAASCLAMPSCRQNAIVRLQYSSTLFIVTSMFEPFGMRSADT
uniref:Uncharacterized protein n=1 Tax=Anopheles atroparvus TaxID=41427 RepID=A0A182J2F4_ANOAO